MSVIGLIGALIILGAWIFETTESVKRHKSLIDLRFTVACAIGTIFLAIYSFQIGNEIFFWLNIVIAAIEGFEIWYSVSIKKIHKK